MNELPDFKDFLIGKYQPDEYSNRPIDILLKSFFNKIENIKLVMSVYEFIQEDGKAEDVEIKRLILEKINTYFSIDPKDELERYKKFKELNDQVEVPKIPDNKDLLSKLNNEAKHD